MPLAAIQSAIQDVLQRAPNPGEAESYLALETSGQLSAAEINNILATSAEAQKGVWPIVGAYSTVFGRLPDKGGLDFWVDTYRSFVNTDVASTPENEALIYILKIWVDPTRTPEFATNFGTNPDGAAYVSAVFDNVLGRAGDPAGNAFWTNVYNAQLAAFASRANPAVEARAWVLDAFLRSAEFHNTKDAATIAFLNNVALDPDPAGAYVGTLRPTVVGTTFTLTIGVDTGDAFTGGAGNDTFIAGDTTATTWTVGDVINGGLGNDTFSVIRASAIAAAPTGASVSGIETVNLTSGATVAINTTTGFSGMTALNTVGVGGATITGAATTALSVSNEDAATSAEAIAVNGGSTVVVNSTNNKLDTITVGATTAAAGAVTVNSSSIITTVSVSDSMGAIAVTGGTSVTINQTAANQAHTGDVTVAGAVTVNGTGATTSVTVTDSAQKAGLTAAGVLAGSVGHTNAGVTIADANAGTVTTDTITTVSLRNYAASTIDSAALNNLTLSGGTINASGTLGINRTTDDLTNNATVLALNMAGGKVGAISGTHAADFVTVNANTTVASTIADITFAGMTTLNATGAALLTLTANTIGALTAVTSGAGGISMGTALANTVSFTGGAGKDSIKIGDTTKALTLGAGDDTVTTSTGTVGTGGSVDAGTGTGDKIIFTTTAHAATAGSSSVFNNKFTGFEVVELSAALTANTVNVGAINNASSIILKVGGAVAGTASAAIIDDLVSGGTVTTERAGTDAGFVVNIAGAGGGVNDILNLTLKNVSVQTLTSVTAANTETINISVKDATSTSAGTALGTAAVTHAATLVATSAKTIVVTGNNGLTLTNTGNVAVTSFDASGVVSNDTAAFITSAGVLVTATTDAASYLAVTYASATTEAATTVGQTVTIKGGAGDDVLRGNALKDVITGNAGMDDIYSDNIGTKEVNTLTLTYGAGASTITIDGIASNYTAATDLATSTVLAAAAINANASLAGLVTATSTTTEVVITYLTDGDHIAATGTGTTTGVNAETTAGTAGTAAVDTIDGGAGADLIVGGGGADVITTGLGADILYMMKGHSNLNATATITDFTFATGGSSNDILILGDVASAIGTVTTVQDFSAQATLALALDAAALANTGVANGLSVFIFGGNEYVFVETTAATNTYVAGDFVVKLTGLPLASGAVIAGSGFDAV